MGLKEFHGLHYIAILIDSDLKAADSDNRYATYDRFRQSLSHFNGRASVYLATSPQQLRRSRQNRWTLLFYIRMNWQVVSIEIWNCGKPASNLAGSYLDMALALSTPAL